MIETTTMEQPQNFVEAGSENGKVHAASATASESALSFRVRVLTTEHELASIESAWRELSMHPHADPAFYRTVIRTSPPSTSSYVLAVEREGRVACLLLGRVEDQRFEMRLGYARLPQPKVRALVFIYGGLLGEPTTEECKALAQTIRHSLKDGTADVAFFNHLRTDSPLYPMLHEHSGAFVRDRYPVTAVHRCLTIPADVDAFWKQLPYKARGNFRWNVKTFLKANADRFSIRCYTKPEELGEMLGKIEKIASKTYQRSLGVGFGTSEVDVARLRAKAENGWLRAYVLSIEEEPVAFFCGTHYRGVFHGDYLGFDPALRRHSPGIFLVIKVVEQLCQDAGDERVAALDFGLGDSRYKADLCDQSWEDSTLCLFAPTVRGIALSTYRTPVLAADRLARRVFNKQVQERIKAKWRAFRRDKNAKAANTSESSD